MLGKKGVFGISCIVTMQNEVNYFDLECFRWPEGNFASISCLSGAKGSGRNKRKSKMANRSISRRPTNKWSIDLTSR